MKDCFQAMSNELLTPILLQVDQSQDQLQAVLHVLEKHGMSNVVDRIFLNETKETISIEMVRQLIENLSYATQEKARLVVLFHAEQLSLAAQQAMLKTLEEPPTRTLIVLVTTQPTGLLPTIQSRCVLMHSGPGPASASETERPELPEMLTTLIEKPTSVSLSQCIDLAEQYKDRGEAIGLINQAITWVHAHQDITVGRKTNSLKTLQHCLENLQKNALVQLALEHCFFELQK